MKKRDENKNIKQTKIAVDFQAKFNRPITRLCISQVGNGEIVPVKLWQRANCSKFPRRYTKNPRLNERKAIFFLLFEKLIKYEIFLFPSKNSESPEIFFLLHFQRAKKVSTKTGMSTKTVSTKIGMDCTVCLSMKKTENISVSI